MTAFDAWSELAFIAIAAQSGTDIPFQALTETVDIDTGDKDIEVLPMLSGGRIVKFVPQTETTITLEAYPLEVGNDTIASATTGTGFWDLLHQEDTAQAAIIASSRLRNKYRMAILWTDDTAITGTNTAGAAAVIASAKNALRFVAADGYFTAVKPSFTDGILKFTITFKCPPFNKSGTAMVKMESLDGTATTLAALASYTSSTPF